MGHIAHETTRPSGFRILVESDDEGINPCKEWDMVGTMVLGHRCRYNFGHETATYDEIEAICNDKNNIVLPVYMYDHSGITINTTGFSCPWDSGQVGIIYCTRKKAVHEFGKKLCTKKVEAAAINCMVGEVETVDDCLTGNVWGFQVFNPNGDLVESCWGFVGDSKYCLEEAVRTLNYLEARP